MAETIIVSRFDRIEHDDGTLGRLHQEDLLQALGVHPDSANRRAKYQAVGTSGPPSWWHAADLLDSYALDADTQLRQLVRIVTYTTAIANADCHAKNIAFLVDDGRIRLAPLYDTVPTARGPSSERLTALRHRQRRLSPMRSITVDDIAAEARRWGLPFDAAHTEATGLLEALLDQVQHADHDEVAALVATNTRRLLDQTAR